jgi:hypothetical protein
MGGVISFPDDLEEISLFSIGFSKSAHNHYICTEDTMGIPTSSMPDKHVYYLSSFSLVRLAEILQEYLADDVFILSPHSGFDSRIDEYLLIKQLSQRLEQLNI